MFKSPRRSGRLARVCEQCSNLNFDRALKFPDDVDQGREEFSVCSLGIWKDLKRRKCIVCKLFAQLCPPGLDHKKNFFLHAVCDNEILSRSEQFSERARAVFGVLVDDYLDDSTKKKEMMRNGAVMQQTVCQREPGSGASFERSDGCIISPRTIDFNRVKSWLTNCHKSHRFTCGIQESFKPMSLRFIDCVSLEITEPRSSEKYFALSYVWGKSSKHEDLQIGRKSFMRPSTGVPKIIQDAIIAVKKLGGRYLWVDRYCINQSDSLAKHYHIQNMDRIYQGAYATIVGCAGGSAATGLPGISRSRRDHPHVYIGNQCLFSTLPHVSYVLAESLWITRGWTYQEAILSRRLLFFTDAQLYCVCLATACCETIGSRQWFAKVTDYRGSTMQTPALFDLDFTSNDARNLIINHICEYSRRNLTFDSDALNAFSGILHRCAFPSYQGVLIAPVTWSPTPNIFVTQPEQAHLGFVIGLCWWPDEAKGQYLWRRPSFPSWTWAGWKGPIQYRYPDELRTQDCDVTFSIRDNGGQFKAIHDIPELLSGSMYYPQPDLSPDLRVAGYTRRLRFQSDKVFDSIFVPMGRDRRFGVCNDHLELKHSDKDTNCFIKHVRIYEKVIDNKELSRELEENFWTCLTLYQKDRRAFLLILRRQGHHYERVGSFTIYLSNNFMSLPWRKQTILLK